ncbi:hypothetical protein [Paraburkholderia hayleyella]|uniref:hypothetical protein n=1 Tax=Paraburkholderia hayleyella TaxID=2152889 RepID=UPI001292BA08|nr:hypothetical protein [Paraburkholderia hayleyella]
MVDDAVFVEIELAQRFKAVRGERAIGELREIAEEFGAGVDQAIVVAVEDEQAVAGADPAGVGAAAFAGEIVQSAWSRSVPSLLPNKAPAAPPTPTASNNRIPARVEPTEAANNAPIATPLVAPSSAP